MVETPEAPGARETLGGDALIEKSLVSGPQLGNPRDWEDVEAAVAAHGRPVIRTPACAR